MRFTSSFKEFKNLANALLGKGLVKTTNQFNNNSWMESLDDEGYLSSFTIPGTHDSCALYEPFSNIAKCQSYTVTDQLNMGIRYLDLRTQFIFNKTYMVHNCVIMGSELKDILNECYSFLKANPTEAIVISFKTDAVSILPNKAPYTALKDEISSNSNMWYTLNKMPKLKDIRGKLVLINRLNPKKQAPKDFCEADSVGLTPERRFTPPYALWLDNESFTIKNKPINYHIQDFYIFKDNDLYKKWEFIKGKLLKAKSEKDFESNLYINYLSGLSGILPDIKKVNSFISPKINSFLDENPKGSYGIIAMDFANKNLCQKLIDSNKL